MPFIPLDEPTEQPQSGFIPLEAPTPEEPQDFRQQKLTTDLSEGMPSHESIGNIPSPTATQTGRVFQERGGRPSGFMSLIPEREPEDPYAGVIGKSALSGAATAIPETIFAGSNIIERYNKDVEDAYFNFFGISERFRPSNAFQKREEVDTLGDYAEQGIAKIKEFFKPKIRPESTGKQLASDISQSVGGGVTTFYAGGIPLYVTKLGIDKSDQELKDGATLPEALTAGGATTLLNSIALYFPAQVISSRALQTFAKKFVAGTATHALFQLSKNKIEEDLIDSELLGKEHTQEEKTARTYSSLITAGIFSLVQSLGAVSPKIKGAPKVERGIGSGSTAGARAAGPTTAQPLPAIVDKTGRAVKLPNPIIKRVVDLLKGTANNIAKDGPPTPIDIPQADEGFIPLERTTAEIQGDIDTIKGDMLKKAMTNQPAEAEAQMLMSLETELTEARQRTQELPSQEQVVAEHKATLQAQEQELETTNKRISKLSRSASETLEGASLRKRKNYLEKQIESQKEIVKSVEEQVVPEPTTEPEVPRKPSRKGNVFMDLTPSKVESLKTIKKQLMEGEAPMQQPARDKEGYVIPDKFVVTMSSNPEYFKNKKYSSTKAEIIQHIDKVLLGQDIAPGQRDTVDDLLKGFRSEQAGRLTEFRGRPADVPAVDLREGDAYKIHGEEFTVKEELDNGNIVVEDGERKVLSPDDTVQVDRGTLFKQQRGFIPLEEDVDFAVAGDATKTGFVTPSEEKPLIEMPELIELYKDINEGKYPEIRKSMGRKYGVHRKKSSIFGKEADILLRADIFTGDLLDGISVKPKDSNAAFETFKENYINDIATEQGIPEDDLVFQKDFNRRTGLVDLKVYRKNPQLAAHVTAHEIGHHIDYMDDKDMKRGNILGRLKSFKRHMAHTIDALPTDPSQMLTKKDRGKLRREATELAGKAPEDRTSDAYKAWKQDVNGKYRVLINNEIIARDLVTRDEIINELKMVSQERAPFDPSEDESYTKYRYSSKELYADAVSAFVNTPDMFKRLAPKFRKSFLAYMKNKPQVKNVYDSIINRIGRGRAEVVDKRIENVYNMIGEGNVARQEMNERNRQDEEGVYDTMMHALIDVEHAKLKPIRRQELQGGEIAQSAREARYDLEEIPYIASEAENYNYEVNQLVEQAKEIGITKDDIGVYGFAKRIPSERENIANPLGFSAEDSVELLDGLRKKWGDQKFQAVEQIVQDYRRIREELIIPRMEESGYYSPETIELIKENSDYMKFSIFKHLKDKFGSGVAAKIHKQVGTLSGAENPFIATVMQDMSILRAITINSSKQSMTNILASEAMIEPANMRWSKDAGRRVPLPPKDPKKDLFTVMVDGRPQHYYVSKVIADSYEHSPFEATRIARIWNTLNAPIRAILVNKNPLWMARNVVKDLKTTIKNNPEIKLRDVQKLLLDYKKALGEAWKDVMRGEKSEDIQALLRGKALLPDRAYEMKEQRFDDELDRLADKFSIVAETEATGAWAKVKKSWDWLDKLGKVSERTGKVAGYKYLKNRTDLSEREIAHRVRTRIGTPDVKRKGSLQWLTNNLFMFSNVNKEGIRSTYESYKQDPSAYIWKTIAMNMLPKLALAGFGAAALMSDDDDMKRLYSNIPENDMKNYTSIPLFLTEDDKTVYLRIPDDYQGQLFGALAWDAAQGKFVGEESVLSTLGREQPYKLNPALELGIDLFTYYVRGKNPYDDFRGRPVIPDLAYQTGGKEAHKAMLKHAWSTLGGNAIYRPSYNINRDKASIEKILSTPPFNVLGEFIRISDRGVSEKYYKTLEEARKDKAKLSLARQRTIVGGVNGGLTNDQILDELEKQDLFTTRALSQVRKYRALKVDSPEVNAYALARSNEEKQALEKKFKETMTDKEVDAVIDKYLEWVSIGEE
jgi:hypothetical protein